MEPPVKPTVARPKDIMLEASSSQEMFVCAMYGLAIVIGVAAFFVWSWFTWPRDLALWDVGLGYGPYFYTMLVLAAGSLIGLTVGFLIHIVIRVLWYRRFMTEMRQTGWYDYDKDKAAYIHFKMNEYHASLKG